MSKPGEGWDSVQAPGSIEELAEACVQYVQRALGVPLDFTAETLSLLDHYLRDARDRVQGRPELLPLVTRALGAYFGEVVRRRIPSFWLVAGGDAANWRLCAVHVWLAFNPVGIAYDALYEGVEHDGPSSELHVTPEERETVEQRLSALPAVTETEFYSFVARYEAIEIAADALQAQMIEGGGAGVQFDASDYETPLGIGSISEA